MISKYFAKISSNTFLLMLFLNPLDIHQCHLWREITTFTKCFTNNKKQHTSLKLMFKVNSKVSEEIYARYVDDTLLVIKHKDVCYIQNLLNNFDPSLCFMVDFFQNEVPHLLDLESSPDGIPIFRKNTNTSLYTHFSTYILSK